MITRILRTFKAMAVVCIDGPYIRAFGTQGRGLEADQAAAVIRLTDARKTIDEAKRDSLYYPCIIIILTALFVAIGQLYQVAENQQALRELTRANRTQQTR